MAAFFSFNTSNLQFIYDTIINHKKERFETILEPLQSILQLALLSFCPVGSKITIHNNLLQIQLPNYTQPFVRWYNKDNRDDLFYLFNVCKRFSKFYGHLRNIRIQDDNLYELLVSQAKIGLSILAQTYANTEKVSLLHTLNMYKVLLQNPSQFDLIENGRENTEEIDKVFQSITTLYSDEDYRILHNVLRNLKQEETIQEEKIRYIYALNSLMNNKFSKIRKWINTHIVF